MEHNKVNRNITMNTNSNKIIDDSNTVNKT